MLKTRRTFNATSEALSNRKILFIIREDTGTMRFSSALLALAFVFSVALASLSQSKVTKFIIKTGLTN